VARAKAPSDACTAAVWHEKLTYIRTLFYLCWLCMYACIYVFMYLNMCIVYVYFQVAVARAKAASEARAAATRAAAAAEARGKAEVAAVSIKADASKVFTNRVNPMLGKALRRLTASG